MRLLQLAVGPNHLIDLHPLVSVVTGLDAAKRQGLNDAVVGLAHGSDAFPHGLLEAHGVLFDLAPDMLQLLDIEAAELRPIVTGGDLPAVPFDPARQERTEAQRLLAGAEQRLAEARAEHLRAQEVRTAAMDAVARARQARTEAAVRADEAARLDAELEAARRERRRLEAQLAAVEPVTDDTAPERARLEEAVAAARADHDQALARHAELEAQLQRARQALAPGAEAAAARAALDLVAVEAEVDAAQDAAPAPEAGPAEPTEPPEERLEAVVARLTAVDLQLAAFAPVEGQQVVRALERVRPPDGVLLEPVPEAVALATEIEALDRDLAKPDDETATAAAEVTAARSRLEAARQSLVEAEISVRNPELDRDIVHELEQVHADLLDAIDRADSRFGGARAQRRVDELRHIERALLDQLGFTSYSDYMMGYSLLNVDPEKEAALDAARLELTHAEDEWEALEAEAEAELARAQMVELRRARMEAARVMLGRPVAAASVVEELRALRKPTESSPDSADELRVALAEVGLVLGDEVLSTDDLILVAESWLTEADAAPERQQHLQVERDELERERADLQARIDGTPVTAPAAAAHTPEVLRHARLQEARELARSTEARLAAHRSAEETVISTTEALAVAREALQQAEEAAARAADELATAPQPVVDDSVPERSALEASLADAIRLEAEVEDRRRAREVGEGEATEAVDPALDPAAAEAAATAAESEAARVAASLVEIEEARHQAARAVADLGAPSDDEAAVAEEIEWYILARLAAQRSVSLGGSLPLLIDDALGGLGEDELGHLLGRLERMAQAVQIIIISDEPSATAWAESAGRARAAVVQPQPA